MGNLTHWDAAIAFNAEEAAALAIGIDPGEPGYLRTKSKHLYERMEHCYRARKSWLQLPDNAVVHWDEIGITNHDQMLDSIEMHYQSMQFDFDDGKQFALWMTDASRSAFEAQRFSRQEFSRWLAAIGVESLYRFAGTQLSSIEGPGGHWPWGDHHTKTLGYLELLAVL